MTSSPDVRDGDDSVHLARTGLLVMPRARVSRTRGAPAGLPVLIGTTKAGSVLHSAPFDEPISRLARMGTAISVESLKQLPVEMAGAAHPPLARKGHASDN